MILEEKCENIMHVKPFRSVDSYNLLFLVQDELLNPQVLMKKQIVLKFLFAMGKKVDGE
jgi:hypothetical protein